MHIIAPAFSKTLFRLNSNMKYFWILISFSFVILVACPPPSYEMKFMINGEMQKEAVIREDSLSVTITGYHMPMPSPDYIFLKFHFERIGEMDSAFCEKVIRFVSNRYEMSVTSGLVQGSPSDCCLNLYYAHKEFTSMSTDEFNDYLDSTYLRISLNHIFRDSYEIYPVFDRKWLAKRFSTNLKNENLEQGY